MLLSVAIFFQMHLGRWADILYYDGDNITLALVVQSLLSGEAFAWKFSSQSFIFPEGPLYLLCYAITQHYSWALLLNAYLNIGLLLFFWRSIVCQLSAHKVFLTADKPNQVWFCNHFFMVSLLLFFSLEAIPDINRYTIFSLLLLQTYYAGVVLVALAQLVLLCSLPLRSMWGQIGLGTLIVLIGGLTYASDPLYLLQFLVPLAVLGMVLIGIKRHRVWGFKLLACSLVSLLSGFVVRSISSNLVSASVGSYVRWQDAAQAAHQTWQMVQALSVEMGFYAFSWCLVLLFYVVYVVYCCYLFAKRKSSISDTELLVYGFLFLAPPLILLGVIVSGNVYTRYWLPIPFYVSLGATLMLAQVLNRRQRAVVLSIFLIGAIGVFAKQYQEIMLTSPKRQSQYAKSVQCFNQAQYDHALQSVGGYWDVRYLRLYGSPESKLFQVHPNFAPYYWLSNTHDYQRVQINSVIVSHRSTPGFINTQDVRSLGQPSIIEACPLFDIYYYAPSSLGAQLLNKKIRVKP